MEYHTPETEAGQAVAAEIDIEQLADDLSGRGSGLRVSKPDTDGMTQYIWRNARFNSGADTSMPVTASWWLQSYLTENGIDAKVSGVMDEAGKDVTAYLDGVVDAVLIALDEGTDAAAIEWHRVGAL